MSLFLIAITLACDVASAGSTVRSLDLAAPAAAAPLESQPGATRGLDGVLLRVGEGALAADRAGAPRLLPAGASLSLDVVDADIRSVLRLVGETADLDFILDDSVQAKVTARLVDVPWNYALLAILQSHGLVAIPVGQGGMMRIAPRG